MYHNTTQESPEQVIMFSNKNENQDEIILSIIKKLDRPFSAKDIYKRFPVVNVPMTSIRRSLNTLKDKSKLIDFVYLEEQKVRVIGLYGRNEYQYKIVE